ncbi:MAG: glycosyltransferase family 2 protein [Oscillatoriales cyanobacterium C42_A2020_001]|nr:glycosyltransferase family 2 protein [Leptolyngbyaceae cyanobacterium C42_A2020_001]
MISESPKVSVIIPNYNHARFLPKRITSILNQTYQNFEVIYLDDASTDNSNEVFSDFASHPKIRSYLNTINTGNPFKQWNKGVQAAKGEYVWIAESDDFADPKLLETLVNALAQNPTAGFAYCQSWEVDENDRVLSNYQWLTAEFGDRWQHSFTSNGTSECTNYMIFRNTVPNASAVLIRRSTYLAVGGAPEEMRLCGDWIFWVKLLLSSDVVFVADALNYFRRANSKGARGQAGKGGRYIEERFKVLQYICQSAEIPQTRKLDALYRFVNHWIEFSIKYQMPFERHQTIYAIASQLDTNLKFQLIYRVPLITMKHISRQMGFTDPIKSLLRKPKLSGVSTGVEN